MTAPILDSLTVAVIEGLKPKPRNVIYQDVQTEFEFWTVGVSTKRRPTLTGWPLIDIFSGDECTDQKDKDGMIWKTGVNHILHIWLIAGDWMLKYGQILYNILSMLISR